MSMDHQPHHSFGYAVQARRVRDAANANALTRCWRCGRTLAEVRQSKPKARWTAGHIVDGQVGGALLAECSPCNYGSGAKRMHLLKRLEARQGHPPPTVTW